MTRLNENQRLNDAPNNNDNDMFANDNMFGGDDFVNDQLNQHMNYQQTNDVKGEQLGNNTYNIIVDTPTEEKVSVNVHSGMTVGEVKQKMMEMGHQNADKFTFIAHGKKLDDTKTMGDYDINQNTIVNSVAKLQGG